MFNESRGRSIKNPFFGLTQSFFCFKINGSFKNWSEIKVIKFQLIITLGAFYGYE